MRNVNSVNRVVLYELTHGHAYSVFKYQLLFTFKLPLNLEAKLLIIQKLICMSTTKPDFVKLFFQTHRIRSQRQSPILLDSAKFVKRRNTDLTNFL